MKAPARLPATCEICILAGGLSARMGRDKARLRFGRRTLLGEVRKSAKATGLATRVIRRDCVPRCGALGGVYTALKSTPAEVVLFLACDMPLVTPDLMQALLRKLGLAQQALFVSGVEGIGFPFLLRRTTLGVVAGQIKRRQLSLRALAKVLKAKRVRLPGPSAEQLRNVNTPSEWIQVRDMWRSQRP